MNNRPNMKWKAWSLTRKASYMQEAFRKEKELYEQYKANNETYNWLLDERKKIFPQQVTLRELDSHIIDYLLRKIFEFDIIKDVNVLISEEKYGPQKLQYHAKINKYYYSLIHLCEKYDISRINISFTYDRSSTLSKVDYMKTEFVPTEFKKSFPLINGAPNCYLDKNIHLIHTACKFIIEDEAKIEGIE